LTGVVVTKLDGTARGGVVVALTSELGLPVKWVGVGEQMDDLQDFDPERFVEALFG
jgi:fused signal recognition particle receptor